MGIYLNPGNRGYFEMYNSEIFVDKSLLIDYTNKILNKKINQFVYQDQED